MMKKIAFLLLVVLLYSISSCKKKKTTVVVPSIVRTWTLANVSGAITNSSSNQNQTEAYFFDSGTKTLLYQDYHYNGATNPPTTQYDTITYKIATEQWAFHTDGTYIIIENYTQKASFSTTTKTIGDTCMGVWDYLSNTNADAGIMLTGNLSGIISPSLNSMFVIKTLTSDSLVFTDIRNAASYNGSISSTALIYTFARNK